MTSRDPRSEHSPPVALATAAAAALRPLLLGALCLTAVAVTALAGAVGLLTLVWAARGGG